MGGWSLSTKTKHNSTKGTGARLTKLLHKAGIALQEGPSRHDPPKADVALDVSRRLASRQDIQERL